LYVEVLSPNVLVVLGGRAFGGDFLGHEGRALMNEIRAFAEENPKNYLTSSALEDTARKLLSMNTAKLSRHQNCWHLDLRLPSLQNYER
jgi:hypothetical protein